MMMKWIFTLLGALMMFCSAALVANESKDVSAELAWIRDAPPMASMRAGYVDVRNNSDQAIEIVSASSADFGLVEMHETRFENDLAKMVELPSVRIEAGEVFRFKPGAAHFMLMRPSRALALGDQTEIVLKLRSGESLAVQFVVSPQPKSDP